MDKQERWEIIEEKQTRFEGWAIIEMMGHRREIGYVTTQAFGQAVLFQVDTPELPEREHVLDSPGYIGDRWVAAGTKVMRKASPGRSCLVAPGSIYAINPCTKEAAIAAIERSSGRPLVPLDLPTGLPGPDDEPDEPDEVEDEMP